MDRSNKRRGGAAVDSKADGAAGETINISSTAKFNRPTPPSLPLTAEEIFAQIDSRGSGVVHARDVQTWWSKRKHMPRHATILQNMRQLFDTNMQRDSTLNRPQFVQMLDELLRLEYQVKRDASRDREYFVHKQLRTSVWELPTRNAWLAELDAQTGTAQRTTTTAAAVPAERTGSRASNTSRRSMQLSAQGPSRTGEGASGITRERTVATGGSALPVRVRKPPRLITATNRATAVEDRRQTPMRREDGTHEWHNPVSVRQTVGMIDASATNQTPRPTARRQLPLRR